MHDDDDDVEIERKDNKACGQFKQFKRDLLAGPGHLVRKGCAKIFRWGKDHSKIGEDHS